MKVGLVIFCTAAHLRILWVFSSRFCSPDLILATYFLFLKLRIAMKEVCFEAVSLFQQPVMTELKAVQVEMFLSH
jgi:hypothetical protein